MTDEEIMLKIAGIKGFTVIPGYTWSMQDWLNKKDVIPCWPVDIAAAWELVEEMIKNNDYPIPSITRVDDDNLWHCFYRVAGDMGYDEYSADTAPRAICLAYIAWKESQHV